MTTIILLFSRKHVRGLLAGLTTHDRIRHVDRWHAAQWVKGVRRNSRRGRLDYKLTAIDTLCLPTDPGTVNFASGSFVHRHQYDELREVAKTQERLAAIGASWEQDSSLEKWFPFSAKELEELKRKALLDEFGTQKHVAKWLAAGTYRTLCHQHDGTFIAADEAERLMIRADTIPLLSDSLLNWPNDAELLPRTQTF